MTGISHPQHVNAKMNEIMLSNDGWEASGKLVLGETYDIL